jgi:hypothetical protein
MTRAYKAESAVVPGTAVVRGSAENDVEAPAADGSGAFIGVYPFAANGAVEADEHIGIALTGVVKVLAGGAVAAGQRAIIKDETGAFVAVPSVAGTYMVCGTFLEDGAARQYVDMLIERGEMTVAAA